jgi:hypothetical protein
MSGAVTPLSPFEESRLRRWLADPQVTRIGRDDVARLVATLDEARGDDPPPEGAHPGEPHDFRAACTRCGEPGTVNLSILAPGEVLRIEPPEARA